MRCNYDATMYKSRWPRCHWFRPLLGCTSCVDGIVAARASGSNGMVLHGELHGDSGCCRYCCGCVVVVVVVGARVVGSRNHANLAKLGHVDSHHIQYLVHAVHGECFIQQI